MMLQNGINCRETYQGVIVWFPRFRDLDEEDRRLIGHLVLGFAVTACKNEGLGRNPILGAVRLLRSIEDGTAEIIYGHDGFAEMRRRTDLRVVH